MSTFDGFYSTAVETDKYYDKTKLVLSGFKTSSFKHASVEFIVRSWAGVLKVGIKRQKVHTCVTVEFDSESMCTSVIDTIRDTVNRTKMTKLIAKVEKGTFEFQFWNLETHEILSF